MLRNLIFLILLTTVPAARCAGEVRRGYHDHVAVEQPTRIDWVFALANQSPAAPPADWLPDFDSKQQTYELFVPPTYRSNKPAPFILFISPSDRAMGYQAWRATCAAQGAIFAGPHGAGNRCSMQQRVRIVLDVLDDVRRHYRIDPDRTYISGFSGGGRVACAIGFSLPEYFGGVIPICAGGELREESWLRQRVIDRLSVAHLTGENDFNRSEVERFRNPLLAGVGVRSRVWVVPKLGHAVPPAKWLTEAFEWVDESAAKRAKLARQYPTMRADGDHPPSREAFAAALLKEAKTRLQAQATRYSGLMQLKGVLVRWPDLPQAAEAKRLLLRFEQGADRSWEEEDIAEQRRFLTVRVRALDAYATGPLPKQYEGQRAAMARAALDLWQIVLNDGQDAQAVADAKQRLPILQKLIDNN